MPWFIRLWEPLLLLVQKSGYLSCWIKEQPRSPFPWVYPGIMNQGCCFLPLWKAQLRAELLEFFYFPCFSIIYWWNSSSPAHPGWKEPWISCSFLGTPTHSETFSILFSLLRGEWWKCLDVPPVPYSTGGTNCCKFQQELQNGITAHPHQHHWSQLLALHRTQSHLCISDISRTRRHTELTQTQRAKPGQEVTGAIHSSSCPSALLPVWNLIPAPDFIPRQIHSWTNQLFLGFQRNLVQSQSIPAIPPPFPPKPAAVISPEPHFLLPSGTAFAPRDCNFPAPMIY